MIPIFTGSVDNGGLKFDRRSSVDEYIGTLIGQRVEVIIVTGKQIGRAHV